MRHIVSKFQIVRHLSTLLRDTSKTDNVFALVDELARLPSLREKFSPTPAMQRFVDQPFQQGFPDLDSLRALPEGSLGRALADHMAVIGADFSAFDRDVDPADEHEWLHRHFYETHDIWHVLTGFGTGPANEIGLQAFTLAQTEAVPPVTLLTLSLTRTLLAGQQEVAPILDAITLGWTTGRRAQPLFGVDWRPHLHRPLAEVRASFGIDPVESAALVEIPERIAA